METKDALLRSVGVPSYLLRQKEAVDTGMVRGFTVNAGGTPLWKDAKQQKKWILDLKKNPVKPGLVFCVSSSPNDLQAKLMALSLLESALSSKSNSTLYGPGCKWHTIIGGYKDSILDSWKDDPERISNLRFLVLANVTTESTPVKREKLRDILEVTGKATRVVAVTGADPVTFFRDMGYHLSRYAWLPSKRNADYMDRT